MKTADLLDLVRVPNVFTAMSDIVAATAVAGAVRPGGAAWTSAGLATAASAALYMAGTTLNDVADSERDARERPHRPIPSGRVGRAQALAIACALGAVGLGLAWTAGPATLLVGALLSASIVVYDLALAGRPVAGPLGMATCRALNLLMGLTAAGGFGLGGWIALGLWFAYVFGITHLSLGEVAGPGRPPVAVAMITTALAAAGVLSIGELLEPQRGSVSWVFVGAALAAFLGRPFWSLGRAWLMPEPARIAQAVGALVSGILWLGAALAVAVADPAWIVPFLFLAAAQEVLRRRFRVT